MKMIKLSERHFVPGETVEKSTYELTPVYVNVANISAISENGDYRCVFTPSFNLSVNETLDEILERIKQVHG